MFNPKLSKQVDLPKKWKLRSWIRNGATKQNNHPKGSLWKKEDMMTRNCSNLSRIALSAMLLASCEPKSKGAAPQPSSDRPSTAIQPPASVPEPQNPNSSSNPDLKSKSTTKLSFTFAGLSKPIVAQAEQNENALTVTLEGLSSEPIQGSATVLLGVNLFSSGGDPLSDEVCKAVRTRALMISSPSHSQAAFDDIRKRNTITFTWDAVPFLDEQNAAVKKAATEAGLKFGRVKIVNPIAFKSAKVSLKTEPGSIIDLVGEKAKLEQILQEIVNSGVAKRGSAIGYPGAYDLICDIKSGIAQIDISLEGEGIQATSHLAKISAVP